MWNPILKYKVKKVLKEAKSLVEQGWIQDKLSFTYIENGVHKTKYCAVGALVTAWSKLEMGSKEQLEARNILERVVGGNGIATFNDEPGRTKEEVIAKFEEAIAKV